MGLLADQPLGDSSNKIPPDILRRLKAGEDVPGYVVDRRPVQVPRGTSYGADAEFMDDPSGAMTTLIYKTTGRNTWKSNGDTADVYDEDGNFIGVSSGDSNSLAMAKFIASSVAAGYGADYVNGLEAGATASSGMGNGAFLGENVASGVGAWDAAATSAGLDLGGGAALSSAGDMGGSDLLDLTHEGVNFGSDPTAGSGTIKANASTFGPNYSNAASGLGTKAASGGAGFFESFMNSLTFGDVLKTTVGVAGVMAGNDAARDLAKENREFSTDQTKANQEFTSTENEKNRNFTSTENDKTRTHNNESREDTQLFTGEENQKTRDWNTEDREDKQDFDVNKTDNQRAYDRWLQEEAWKRMSNAGTGGSYSFVPRRGLLG